MKWADGISILSILLSGSTFFLISGTGIRNASGSPPSTAVAVNENGAAALLDTLISTDDVGVMTGEKPPEPEPPPPEPAPQPQKTAPPAASCVNINTANETQLITLRGIGPATASAIITHRNQNGAFRRKEDIQKVRGIGPAKYAQIAEIICAQ